MLSWLMNMGFAGSSASINAVTLAVDPGVYSITGADIGTPRALVVNAVAGSYTVTGVNATPILTWHMGASPGSYVIGGQFAYLKGPNDPAFASFGGFSAWVISTISSAM